MAEQASYSPRHSSKSSRRNLELDEEKRGGVAACGV
jgi:hypothetical protein